MCGMKDSLRSKITPRNLVSSTTGTGVGLPFSSRVGSAWGLRNLQKCMHTVLEGENLNLDEMMPTYNAENRRGRVK